MSPKIYKWQKRNKNNNKHNFTKDLDGSYLLLWCFMQGHNLKLCRCQNDYIIVSRLEGLQGSVVSYWTIVYTLDNASNYFADLK